MNQGVVDSLERRYRRLLVAYPVAYREERAEEIIATLLSAAEPGRHMPSVGEVLDLVSNGLRTRVRLYRRAGADLAAPGS